MATHGSKTAAVRDRALAEMKELAILTAYFYIPFVALVFFKSAILEGRGVAWWPWGFAAIKAALIAKFVLVGRTFHVAERRRTSPLIWQTLHQSIVFLPVVVVLDFIEEIVIGLIHGQGTGQTIRSVVGRNPEEMIAEFVIVFLLFFPYFAFRSIGELLGEGVLLRLFFVRRQKLIVSSDHLSQR
jgi:hypothetical protein